MTIEEITKSYNIKELRKELKRMFSYGSYVKCNEIHLNGDQCEKVKTYLIERDITTEDELQYMVYGLPPLPVLFFMSLVFIEPHSAQIDFNKSLLFFVFIYFSESGIDSVYSFVSHKKISYIYCLDYSYKKW